MDGRDIGTVVLPEAQLKIFLTASVDVRAERRVLQLKEKGTEADINTIKEDIRQRDHQDMTRKASPLKQAEDALFLDTSFIEVEDVADKIISLAMERK